MKLGCIAAFSGQLHDFEDSRCFFLSTFCFLLDIFRQKSTKTWSLPPAAAHACHRQGASRGACLACEAVVSRGTS